jgi:hypothetical protein
MRTNQISVQMAETSSFISETVGMGMLQIME